jgi:hypothetical protein
MQLSQLETLLDAWQKNLCQEVGLAELISRNETAHKWKVTYCSIVLREAIIWRFVDLMSQVAYLLKQKHILGSRLLIRSAIETLGILIYLNQKTEAVIEERISFWQFIEVTNRLMFGSKNQFTELESINILTVLNKCEERYPGIVDIYNSLSESAHPNFDGVCMGYSKVDKVNYKTEFKNRWVELFDSSQLALIENCLKAMEEEYNQHWPKTYEKLEKWLVQNNEILELEKNNN